MPKAPLVGVMQALNNTYATDVFSSRTKLILEALMALMCIGAITGNILVIVIVAATKTFHSVTSVLIINLAISDLLVGIGVMPFVALSLMHTGWVDCTALCLYVGYTSSVYCTASVLTLAAIALDRYYSIVDCLRYASRCTLWRTCAVVLWIWMQALATSCPPLLGWSSVSYVSPMYSCAVRWATSPSYTVFMAVLSYAVPAAVILFCYVNIVQVARGHARRIHTLEEYLQRRSRNTSSADPTAAHRHWGNHRGTTTTTSSSSTLVYHLSGRFVSESPSNPPPRGMLSFLAQGGGAPPPGQNNNNNNNNSHQPHTLHQHQGLLRLFLVISAFFLCWTPYMGVAMVQAAETALSVRSSRVPPSAVTFSYWLLLLNSDINPLLYALLSKQFQNALRRLKRKVRARLGGSVVAARRREETRDQDLDEGRTGGGPSTVTSSNADLRSASATSTHRDQDSRYCSSVFTVDTEFRRQSEEHLCGVLVPGSTSPSCSYWDHHQHPSGGDATTETPGSLQVPSRTQEGARLPCSALTRERQATFFYGQITVRVEQDVC